MVLHAGFLKIPMTSSYLEIIFIRLKNLLVSEPLYLDWVVTFDRTLQSRLFTDSNTRISDWFGEEGRNCGTFVPKNLI